MFANADEIVLQVRAECEDAIALVMGASSETAATADAMERSLLGRLFELGRLSLRLYSVRQAQQCRPEAVLDASGQSLPYHSEKERSYHSVFGTVPFSRRYGVERPDPCQDQVSWPHVQDCCGAYL